MFSVFSAVDQPFKTIMAVTHDRIGRIPAAVFFHYAILFVYRVREKQTLGPVNIMLRSQFWISRRLRPVKRISAKICSFVIVRRLDKLNVHFSEQIPYRFLLVDTVFGSPAILQRYCQSGMIGKTESLVPVDQLPK